MIEEKPEGIGTDENRSRFDGVGGLAPYGDDWKDREKHEKKSDKKAGSGGKSHHNPSVLASLRICDARCEPKS